MINNKFECFLQDWYILSFKNKLNIKNHYENCKNISYWCWYRVYRQLVLYCSKDIGKHSLKKTVNIILRDVCNTFRKFSSLPDDINEYIIIILLQDLTNISSDLIINKKNILKNKKK